jgi:predicted nuclease of predicted toxin-antitoxin system
MPNYLIDTNLPYYFSLWNTTDYIHQIDIQNDLEDSEIWKFAKEQNLTIVTKDADFSERILLATPPPRVIHLRIGNLSMRAFFTLITSVWDEVTALSKEYKLVVVFNDKIEAFN